LAPAAFEAPHCGQSTADGVAGEAFAAGGSTSDRASGSEI
jgi:hypothetical protein